MIEGSFILMLSVRTSQWGTAEGRGWIDVTLTTWGVYRQCVSLVWGVGPFRGRHLALGLCDWFYGCTTLSGGALEVCYP